MTERIDTGGPAFPRTGFYPDTSGCKDIDSVRERLGACTDPNPGMTLRDYFAAKALTGLVQIGAMPNASPAVVADYAYRFADGMLAARKAVKP